MDKLLFALSAAAVKYEIPACRLEKKRHAKRHW
jgi:hypothetical protein